jgi:hypothetical protein
VRDEDGINEGRKEKGQQRDGVGAKRDVDR